MNIKLIVTLAIVIAVTGVGGFFANKLYNAGKQEVIQQQDKAARKIERKAHDVQTDALTTPDVDNRLREYSRPD